jgi:hypothetical protein
VSSTFNRTIHKYFQSIGSSVRIMEIEKGLELAFQAFETSSSERVSEDRSYFDNSANGLRSALRLHE